MTTLERCERVTESPVGFCGRSATVAASIDGPWCRSRRPLELAGQMVRATPGPDQVHHLLAVLCRVTGS